MAPEGIPPLSRLDPSIMTPLTKEASSSNRDASYSHTSNDDNATTQELYDWSRDLIDTIPRSTLSHARRVLASGADSDDYKTFVRAHHIDVSKPYVRVKEWDEVSEDGAEGDSRRVGDVDGGDDVEEEEPTQAADEEASFEEQKLNIIEEAEDVEELMGSMDTGVKDSLVEMDHEAYEQLMLIEDDDEVINDHSSTASTAESDSSFHEAHSGPLSSAMPARASTLWSDAQSVCYHDWDEDASMASSAIQHRAETRMNKADNPFVGADSSILEALDRHGIKYSTSWWTRTLILRLDDTASIESFRLCRDNDIHPSARLWSQSPTMTLIVQYRKPSTYFPELSLGVCTAVYEDRTFKDVMSAAIFLRAQGGKWKPKAKSYVLSPTVMGNAEKSGFKFVGVPRYERFADGGEKGAEADEKDEVTIEQQSAVVAKDGEPEQAHCEEAGERAAEEAEEGDEVGPEEEAEEQAGKSEIQAHGSWYDAAVALLASMRASLRA